MPPSGLTGRIVPGTQGYAEKATELIARYEELPFPHKHEAVMHLVPSQAADALDIGAGMGADPYWLASQGHRVVAVEPTAAFRAFALAKHSSPLITRAPSLVRRDGNVQAV